MRKKLYKKGIILSVCFVVIIMCVFGNNINILADNVEENTPIITNDIMEFLVWD